MVGSRNRGHGDTESDGSNFGTIQEVGTEETNRGKETEKVDEECGCDGRTIVVVERSRDCKSKHAGSHTGTTDHEDGATTETLNTEEGNKTREELEGQSTSGEKLGVVAGHAETVLEDDRGIDGNEVGSRHLLEEL